MKKQNFSLKSKSEIKEFLKRLILICRKLGVNYEYAIKSLGSLGGG